MTVDLLGYVAGMLVVLSMLPQVLKSWRTRQTRDLSLWRYVIYVLGLCLWVSYALLIRNGPVALMNSVGLLLATSVLYLKLKHG